MATEPREGIARVHAELHDQLWSKLQDRGRKRSHEVLSKAQCPSPRRKDPSTTSAFETAQTDYASSQEIRTSLQLLAEQQPGSCYFNLALKKILCHTLSRRILCQTTNPTTDWLDDVCHNLRTTGADEDQQQIVIQQLRDLASSTLSPVLQGCTRGHPKATPATAPEDSAAHDKAIPSSKCMQAGEVAGSPDNLARPASKRCKLKQPVPDETHAQSPVHKLRELDFETFASSDLDQRKVLARRACSLPIELYFHHLRRAIPRHAMDYEQASLIWSKLTISQIEQWKALLERFQDGDIAAAQTAGAQLLVEHEILPRLEKPETGSEMQQSMADGLEIADSMHNFAQGRSHQISTRPKTRHKSNKSPYFLDSS